MRIIYYLLMCLVPLLAGFNFGTNHTNKTIQENGESLRWKLLGPGESDMVMSLSYTSPTTLIAGIDLGGLYRSDSIGEKWKSCNVGIKNYDISTPAIVDPWNPSILYVGTRGGFYKSTNGGATWVGKWKGLSGPKENEFSAPIGSIAVSRKTPGLIYMAFGCQPHRNNASFLAGKRFRKALDGKLYTSTDRGENWKAVSTIKNKALVRHILISTPESTIYVATDDGLFVSNDRGQSWTLLRRGEIRNVSHGANNNELIVAKGLEGVSISRDKGFSWNPFDLGLGGVGTTGNYSVLLKPDNKMWPLYVINSSWKGGGGLYRLSSDGNWKLLTPWDADDGMPDDAWVGKSRRVHALAINPLNNSQMFIGTSRFIYRTDDAGISWKQVVSDKRSNGWTHRGMCALGDTRSLAIDPNKQDIMYIGIGDHGLGKSEDRGATWVSLSDRMAYKNGVNNIAVSKNIKNRVYAISGNRWIERSDDSGETWKVLRNAPEGLLYDLLLDPNNADLLYACGEMGVCKTTDGGKHWRKLNKGLPKTVVTCLTSDFKSDSINAGLIYAGTKKGLYRKTRAKDVWLEIGDFRRVVSVLVDRESPDILYVGTMNQGELHRSVDCGLTWSKTITDIDRRLSSIVQMPNNKNVLYASTEDTNYHDECSGAGIFKSIDRGLTWKSINTGLDVLRGKGLLVSPNSPHRVYFCSTGSGVYVLEE